MALSKAESYDERSVVKNADGTLNSVTIRYIVYGATDEDAAVEYVRTSTASWYNGLIKDTTRVGEKLGDAHWKIDQNYREPDESEKEVADTDTTFSFSTGGTTIHLNQSISTRNKYPANAADFGGAINYDGENVHGVDVVRPQYQFSETHIMSPATVTQEYRNLIAHKTGMYNNDPFRGFAAGEVLFLGASAQRNGDDGDDNWQITFDFAVQLNESGLTIGDINVASKRGWDYLWCTYDNVFSEDYKQVLKKPKAVYVEKVYYGTDFNGLGIGTE